MKKVFIALFLAFVPVSGRALPILFEIGYVNYSPVYNAKGCFVDGDRYIYKYGYGLSGSDKPIELLGRLSEAEFRVAQNLAELADQGNYAERRTAVDAGTTRWTATLPYGREVNLKAKGEMAGLNTAPEAELLTKLLDKWCIAGIRVL